MLKSLSGIVLLALLAASLFIPVDLPYDITCTGVCYPLRSWSLAKNTDGTLNGKLLNNHNGQIEDYQSYQFERGDVVNIKFNNPSSSNGTIEQGMPVASILSDMLSQRLVQLQNQLLVEKAKLRSFQTGEKRETVEVAQQEIQGAEVALEFAEQNLERNKELYAEGLIAFAILEQASRRKEQANANLEIAKKGKSVVNTGAKPEEVALVKASINSLEKQINIVTGRSSSYNIVSPISGSIRYGGMEDVYELIVDQIDSMIIQVPIRLKDRSYVKIGDPVHVTPSYQDTTFQAQLVSFDERVQLMDNEQVIVAKALLSGKFPRLPHGMPVSCTINGDSIQPLEYFKRSIRYRTK